MSTDNEGASYAVLHAGRTVARASPGVTTLAVGTGGIHDVAARLRRIR